MGIGNLSTHIAVVKDRVVLKNLILHIIKNNFYYVLLGHGSNVALGDLGNKCLLIINRTSSINYIKDKNIIKVDSGVNNSSLMKFIIKNSLTNIEFLSGLPGTIGGGAAVNAGAFGHSISDFLESALIIDDKGDFKKVNASYFNFSYRNSKFKLSNEAILSLNLKVSEGKQEDIENKIKKYYEYRKINHPKMGKTAGCFFKNYINKKKEKISAGKIIEECNLKEKTVYNTYLDRKHGNFLFNNGNANLKDLKKAESFYKNSIYNLKNIKLDREVIYIENNGEKS